MEGLRTVLRFWLKVKAGGPDECWLWLGAVSSTGYGNFTESTNDHKVKTERAHRMAYKLTVGPIPMGMTIDHLCRTKLCVNTSHMSLATISENVKRTSPQRLRTRCPRGHEYTSENTITEYRHDGSFRCRRCRTCRRSSAPTADN